MAFVGHRTRHAGFTLIELMIAVAVVAILAGVALGQYRDYAKRAKMTEVIMASTGCKTRVTEFYLTATSPPGAGGWGCDPVVGTTSFATAIQTSPNGAIRVRIGNLDGAINGRFVHLVPVRLDRHTEMDADADLGNAVAHWLCGSDSQVVRNALPSECRVDTTPYAAASFQ